MGVSGKTIPICQSSKSYGETTTKSFVSVPNPVTTHPSRCSPFVISSICIMSYYSVRLSNLKVHAMLRVCQHSHLYNSKIRHHRRLCDKRNGNVEVCTCRHPAAFSRHAAPQQNSNVDVLYKLYIVRGRRK